MGKTASRRTIAALFVSLLTSSTSRQNGQVPNCGLYIYRAEIIRIIDGDIVVAGIDLGFIVWLRRERLRLFGVDATEGSTNAGISSLVEE